MVYYNPHITGHICSPVFFLIAQLFMINDEVFWILLGISPGTPKRVGPANPMSMGPIPFPPIYFKGFWIGSSIGMGVPRASGVVPGISLDPTLPFNFLGV